MTHFVILAVPRTGSNLLCTLLNSHPQILCHHEVFNPQGVFTALDYRGQGLAVESLNQRDDDPLGFLNRVWQTGFGQTCVGFKWTRGQNKDVLANVVSDGGVKKIVLHRRNRIKTFVSEQIAQKTQQWEVYDERELIMPRPRITVDTVELLEYIDSNRRFYARLSSTLRHHGQSFFQVEYETLFDRDVQRCLLEFLGVGSQDERLDAVGVKQNSTDLRDTIANFVELEALLPEDDLVTELRDRGL